MAIYASVKLPKPGPNALALITTAVSPLMLHADITVCVHGRWHNLKRTPLALLEKL